MEKCNFSYILHWNPKLDRAVALGIHFVRFCFSASLKEFLGILTEIPDVLHIRYEILV